MAKRATRVRQREFVVDFIGAQPGPRRLHCLTPHVASAAPRQSGRVPFNNDRNNG
jgi:hypothetical protein